MEALLAANEGKSNFVIANNDGMAIGCIAALQTSATTLKAETNSSPVIGVDATDAAKDAIAEGNNRALQYFRTVKLWVTLSLP